jgi:hypothetical protein
LTPVLVDDPKAVPVYPAGTTITLDQSTWKRLGGTASAYAWVMPQNQRVLIHFSHVNDGWYITQFSD